MVEIRPLTGAEDSRYIPDLADVLLDCVEGGASVSFMAGFTRAQAEDFFRNALEGATAGERILLAAFENGRVVGTVQVLLKMPPNQPHRGEIAKMLVHRSARGKGVAAQLMNRAEICAAEAGKTLLVLDTVTGGDAERLYTRLGWQKTGVIPNYALFPDGRMAATTVFWKNIGSGSVATG